MSKRNFILLTIVLVIMVVLVFLFLFTRQNTTAPRTNTVGTNFISTFPTTNKTTTPPNTTPPANVSGYQPNPAVEAKLKLIKVSTTPVAGYAVYTKERFKEKNPSPALPLTGQGAKAPPAKGGSGGLTEFAPSLRYVARATGNIYETFADKIEEKQFSSTVIPRVYEAYFGNSGNSVVMRYLKADNETIETFVGNTPKEYLGTEVAGKAEVKGTFLPEDTKDISVSPDAGSVFYLFNNSTTGNNMVGAILNLATNKKTQILTSPFTEWLSLWPNAKMITLTTKPAAGVPGYMYAMNPTTKNLMGEVFGNINGLTTLTSPNGKLVLYADDSLSTSVYQTDTKTSTLMGVKTLSEKCVWGKASDIVYCAVPKSINAGAYPDAWYQGIVSFSDQIWEIDVKTGNATLLADPAVISGEDVDGIKLALDSGENYLFFVNKKDSFLWELALK